MLNRTNRTLSAHTNRLNLGTRKLDRNASANIGSLTLRTVPAHPSASVRVGFAEYPGIPLGGPSIATPPKPAMPAMPAMSGSSSGSMSPSRDYRAWDQGQAATLASQPAQPVVVLLQDADGTGRGVAPRDSSPRSHSRSSLGWSCERPRLAGRSARAALALVTEATP